MVVRARLRLQNYRDQVLKERLGRPRRVRSAAFEAALDDDQMVGTLPPEIVKKLGLTIGERSRTSPVVIHVAGRFAVGHFIVGLPGCLPTLGHIVMAELDLVADPATGFVIVNPASPIRPTVAMRALTPLTPTGFLVQ